MNDPNATPAQPTPLVLREDQDGVARLTLNRPSQFNALSRQMLGAMESVLDALANDRNVRVVVLGASGRAFCPGHDLKEMLAHREENFVRQLFDQCCRVMLALTRLPQPVIARVHGTATAAGCQLVAACDLAVASTDARFATSGINFGLFCATPGVPLSRAISRKRALEMVLTGNFIDADTALAWGLVNRVTAPETLDHEIDALAQTLLAKPQAALASGKRFFYRQIELDTKTAYREAAAVITGHMLAEEGFEGVSAFVGKRKPRWSP